MFRHWSAISKILNKSRKEKGEKYKNVESVM